MIDKLKVIGLMSGTSLDGLDICYVDFSFDGKNWMYSIVNAISEPYPEEIKRKLAEAQEMNAFDYALFNSDYGLYLGSRVKTFMDKYGATPDIIASHGHTIFHQPSRRFTAQIGSGASIAAESGVDCVCDFRTTDVALYGQGAPLVPIGDRTLFANYDYCLNIGGFSNISFSQGGKRVAYDISPVNYLLNHYTRLIGKEYDEDGKMARNGNVCNNLFQRLNQLDYYEQKGPKSLGREWVEEEIFPLINQYSLSTEDILATIVEHAAYQVGKNVISGKVLVTGGGAFNKFLVERLRSNAKNCDFVVPDILTVNFKEALIFAFLGALYYFDMPNCLSSVTGAKYDCIGGAMYKNFLHR